MSQSPLDSGNAKPPAPRKSSNALEKLWQQMQPLLKKTTVRSLRSTIWLLEQAIVKIEPDAPEATRIAASKTPPVFGQIGRAWTWLLKTIRSILPRSQREKLSDTALSSIIVGTLLLVLWVNSALKPKPTPAQIASRPVIEQPAPDIAIPDTLPAPVEPTIEPEPLETPTAEVSGSASQPEGSEPEPEVAEPEGTEPEGTEPEVAEPEGTEPEAIASQPEGSEPEPEAIVPSASEAETADVSPEPALEPASEPEITETTVPPLTPEQVLVAAIQTQVGDLTNQYGNGLIQNIQANFRSGRLTVKIDDAWYELSQSRQNQLAAEMLDRARSLDFRRLEITDSQGTLVARSPIVGSEMIILRRSIS